ncbi:MAG: PASTA domain-containing protein [Gemmatimonadota bacterium]
MKPISPGNQSKEAQSSVIGPRRRPRSGNADVRRWLSGVSGSGWGRAAVLGLVGLLVGYLFSTRVVFPAAPAPENLITVPDLSGEELSEVAARLEGIGLVVGEVDSVKHPGVDIGGVFGQSPLPGQRALPGSAVRLSVSSGRQEIRVPELVGAPLDQAVALLEASGFTLALDSVEASAPRGTVVGLVPEAGDLVELPATIGVQVSLGPPLVAMPRLIGLSEEEATEQLEALGLRVGDVEVRFRFGLDQGKVIEQEPAPGRQIEEGSTVRLVVGRRAREGGGS